MSTGPSNSDRLEQTLESTRRSVRQLEIEAHRIRADLTRIEAEVESGVAGADVLESRRRDLSDVHRRAREVAREVPAFEVTAPISDPVAAPAPAPNWQPAAEPLPAGIDIQLGGPPQFAPAVEPGDSTPEILDATAAELPSTAETPLPKANVRRAMPPVMTSFALHAALLFLAVSITVVTIVERELPFTASVVDVEEEPSIPIEHLDAAELGPPGDAELPGALVESADFDAAGPIFDDVAPVDFQSVVGPTNLGDLGSFTSLPADLDTMMAGAGGLDADGVGGPSGLGSGNQRGEGGGGSRKGGAMGSSLFFGAESKGNRFVYVVDNSSSMKDGRLQFAVAELQKSVGALTQKQSFYVIFVSDQTYPMFYPTAEPAMLPATAANKQRLAEWLPKAILASGKNRELIKAMDLAASL